MLYCVALVYTGAPKMTTALLPHILKEPTVPATASLIWLHGLGASGNDFVPLLPDLKLDPKLGLRFIFPHASNHPVTINGGYVMPSWFDILTLGPNPTIDLTSFENSLNAIHALINNEINSGVPANKIILCGFSQGGSLALHAGLTYPKQLAGLIGLSTFLLDEHQQSYQKSQANRNTPILLAHGTQDPVVPYSLGQATNDLLTGLSYPVTWTSYDMPHCVCPKQITELGLWISSILSDSCSNHSWFD